jgi:hypothetical protein
MMETPEHHTTQVTGSADDRYFPSWKVRKIKEVYQELKEEAIKTGLRKLISANLKPQSCLALKLIQISV